MLRNIKSKGFSTSSSSVYGENNNFPINEEKLYHQKIFMVCQKK